LKALIRISEAMCLLSKVVSLSSQASSRISEAMNQGSRVASCPSKTPSWSAQAASRWLLALNADGKGTLLLSEATWVLLKRVDPSSRGAKSDSSAPRCDSQGYPPPERAPSLVGELARSIEERTGTLLSAPSPRGETHFRVKRPSVVRSMFRSLAAAV
jgi:hypothetical protein